MQKRIIKQTEKKKTAIDSFENQEVSSAGHSETIDKKAKEGKWRISVSFFLNLTAFKLETRTKF